MVFLTKYINKIFIVLYTFVIKLKQYFLSNYYFSSCCNDIAWLFVLILVTLNKNDIINIDCPYVLFFFLFIYRKLA